MCIVANHGSKHRDQTDIRTVLFETTAPTNSIILFNILRLSFSAGKPVVFIRLEFARGIFSARHSRTEMFVGFQGLQRQNRESFAAFNKNL